MPFAVLNWPEAVGVISISIFGEAVIEITGSMVTLTVVVADCEAAEVGAPLSSNTGIANKLAANMPLTIFIPLFVGFCFFIPTAKYPSCI